MEFHSRSQERGMRSGGRDGDHRRADESGPTAATTGPRIVLVACGRQSPALVSALTERGASVLSFAPDDGRAADLESISRLRPDTVVVGAPRNGGRAEIVERAARAAHDVDGIALALLTGVHEGEATRMLDAGADDVIAPPHSAAAILLRREIARSRGPGVPPAGRPHRIPLGRLELDPVSRGVWCGDAVVYLSGREFDLLVHLGSAPGRAVRRDDLIRAVWGAHEATGSALDATVHRLRRRLRADGFPRKVVETVRGVGYRIAATVLRDDEG